MTSIDTAAGYIVGSSAGFITRDFFKSITQSEQEASTAAKTFNLAFSILIHAVFIEKDSDLQKENIFEKSFFGGYFFGQATSCIIFDPQIRE